MSAEGADERRKLLQVIEGSPQPDLSLEEIARQVGLSREQAGRLIERVEAEGLIRWEGRRPIVVRRASGGAATGGAESYGGDQDAEPAATEDEVGDDRPPAEG